MWKAVAITLFGLAPILASGGASWAAGKTIDMGFIDQATITRACQQQLGTVPRAGGEEYGCRANGVSITCNAETCTATGRDLAPVIGNSLQAVIDAMDRRAGQRILPVDTRVGPVNSRVQ
ncbi:hypothetical protein [Dongia sp.]|uniref:hypothetical protein n=1 Tax=Dongia sp. TaxID=1977262 RepID=UPI003752957A